MDQVLRRPIAGFEFTIAGISVVDSISDTIVWKGSQQGVFQKRGSVDVSVAAIGSGVWSVGNGLA